MESTVKQKFKTYPHNVSESLTVVRSLILRTADEHGITDLVESLKWGEPSVSSKIGTTIRYDWKSKSPNEYRIYFHCQTTLVETFKEVYGNTFEYEGNRALVFSLGDALPIIELSHCISLALRYKKLKHLRLLGA